jgi:glycosyltransferase involved in cell wall biosynthesis
LKNPQLSIIIPTYNSALTIEASLNSVLEQSFKNFEIIVQDGLSKDDTVAIVERIKEQSPAISIQIFKEQDQGVYDAMNKAMVRVKGEWIFFLGSDDKLYSPTILEEVFGQEGLANFNVMYGNVNIIGDTTWAKNGDIYDGEFDFNKLVSRNICHQCIFYRKTITDQIGFYNIDYVLCADWDYNLRCWAKTTFLYMDKVISYFQAGGETTKTNQDPKFENDFLKNLLSYFPISVYDPVINSKNFRYYYQVLNLQKHSFAERAIQKLKRSLKLFINR